MCFYWSIKLTTSHLADDLHLRSHAKLLENFPFLVEAEARAALLVNELGPEHGEPGSLPQDQRQPAVPVPQIQPCPPRDGSFCVERSQLYFG